MLVVEPQQMPTEVQAVEGLDPELERHPRMKLQMADGSVIEVSHVGVAFGLRITTPDGRFLEPLFGPIAAAAIADGLTQVCAEAATDESNREPH